MIRLASELYITFVLYCCIQVAAGDTYVHLRPGGERPASVTEAISRIHCVGPAWPPISTKWTLYCCLPIPYAIACRILYAKDGSSCVEVVGPSLKPQRTARYVHCALTKYRFEVETAGPDICSRVITLWHFTRDAVVALLASCTLHAAYVVSYLKACFCRHLLETFYLGSWLPACVSMGYCHWSRESLLQRRLSSTGASVNGVKRACLTSD